MSETRCIFVGSDQSRMVANRHSDDCASEDCRGCQVCIDPHCVLDGRTHLDDTHPMTCPECVGAVREDLIEIRDLCTHLRERALTGSNTHGRRFASMRLPGGDPLVLVAPVSEGSEDQRKRWETTTDDDRGHLASLELPSDPESPALTLGTWEDDWRKLIGHEAGPRFDYAKSVGYLLGQLTWAAQRHLAFDEFARDMRRVRRHLEDKLADGERAEVTRTPCLNCGTRLIKVYADKAKDDHHKCPQCRRTHDDGEVARSKALVARSEDADAWILLTDAARSIDRTVHTLRTWVAAGKVRVDREYIEGVGGVMTRVYVWWPDVRHADMASGRRSRSVSPASDIVGSVRTSAARLA